MTVKEIFDITIEDLKETARTMHSSHLIPADARYPRPAKYEAYSDENSFAKRQVRRRDRRRHKRFLGLAVRRELEGEE